MEQWCKLNLDNVVQVYVGARNTASETVEQELQFVGSECGKLLAVREIIRKVGNVVCCQTRLVCLLHFRLYSKHFSIVNCHHSEI